MIKLYTISIRWEFPIDIKKIESIDATLGGLGDWLRFDAFTWLLFTTSDAVNVRDALLRSPVRSAEHFLVLKSDPSDVDGWAQPWIWEWIRKAR